MSWLDGPDDLDRVLAEMGPEEAAAYEDARSRVQLLDDVVELRKSRGSSQRAVAEVMDTTQSAVSELEGEAYLPEEDG